MACYLSNLNCILESFFATDVINSLQANIILMPQIEHNEIQPSSRPPPERVKYLHEENCKKFQQSTNCRQHCTFKMKSSHKYTLNIKTIKWTFSLKMSNECECYKYASNTIANNVPYN